MDENAVDTLAAINAAAVAISSADTRYTTAEQSRWKNFWSGLWCFGSQKRTKRIVPAARLEVSSGSSRLWQSNVPAQSSLAIAPPSSPASFVNSSIQSPVSFSLSLSAASANVCSPGPTNTMFTIGPYAHETQLVSPPVFSTFTTEPSTAPFTPPPELAHLTTPSSPDVPFAQLLASSLEAKASARDTASPFSVSTLTSPSEASAVDLQATYQLSPSSAGSCLVSPTTGIPYSEVHFPVPEIEFPSQRNTSFGGPVSSFPKFEPFTCLSNDMPSCAMLILPDSDPEPQQTMFSETSNMACREDCCSDVQSDMDTKFEGGLDIQATDPHIHSAVSDSIHHDVTGALVEREREDPAIVVTGDEAPDASNGCTPRSWQIFHVDARKDCTGTLWSMPEFCSSVAGNSLAKKRGGFGMEKWLQQVEGSQKCAMDRSARRSSDFLEAEEKILQLSGRLEDLMVTNFPNDVTLQDNLNCDLGMWPKGKFVKQEGAMQMSGSVDTLPSVDLRCQKEKQECLNGSKHCVHNVAANGYQKCGELTIKCCDLSAALEQAKERLDGYESMDKEAESPDKNQKHLLQWMHLGIKLQQGNILRLHEKHALSSV
eukprot:c27970_g1_i3 orf=453-2249(+)